MFGTIVVGVDGSGYADHAVQTVAKIAADTRDKVVVFHGVVVYHARATPYTDETLDEAQQLVDRYVAQLASAGVSAAGEIHRELEIGIGGALIDVANSHQAGLIVVGTRGRSDVASMLLGSVSHEVVRKARLPVLVVPARTA
ncbi:MAG TPA: universal stress protein [Streptosporangiaceae bacterium]|nr:universal stress protein [Streptosporangiaceae bacterium]